MLVIGLHFSIVWDLRARPLDIYSTSSLTASSDSTILSIFTATVANAACFEAVLRAGDLPVFALGHKPVVLNVQTSHRGDTGKHIVCASELMMQNNMGG